MIKETILPRQQMTRKISGERISGIPSTLGGRMKEEVIGEMHKEATGETVAAEVVDGMNKEVAEVADGARAAGMLDGALLQEPVV